MASEPAGYSSRCIRPYTPWIYSCKPWVNSIQSFCSGICVCTDTIECFFFKLTIVKSQLRSTMTQDVQARSVDARKPRIGG
jgi:hypothetical protein